MKILYMCDPEKNKECRKRNCHWNQLVIGRCKMTKNPDYAVRDKTTGKPIVGYVKFDGEEPAHEDQ